MCWERSLSVDWEMHFYVIAFILPSPVTKQQISLDNSDCAGGDKQHPQSPALQGFGETSGENPAPRQLLVARCALKAGIGFYNPFYGNSGSGGSCR